MSNQNIKYKKQGRDPVYDVAFKIAVATEYLSSDLGYGKLARKYKLRSESSVRSIVQWYKEHYPQQEPLEQSVIAETPAPQQRPATPALVKELEQARLKIVALETLIAVASRDLGVDITKKAGAKQSKK